MQQEARLFTVGLLGLLGLLGQLGLLINKYKERLRGMQDAIIVFAFIVIRQFPQSECV